MSYDRIIYTITPRGRTVRFLVGITLDLALQALRERGYKPLYSIRWRHP